MPTYPDETNKPNLRDWKKDLRDAKRRDAISKTAESFVDRHRDQPPGTPKGTTK